MSRKSDSYNAIKNLIHNSCGIQKPQIKELVRECVQEMIQQELKSFFETHQFRHMLWQTITGNVTSYGTNKLDGEIRRIIKEVLPDRFLQKIQIDISQK